MTNALQVKLNARGRHQLAQGRTRGRVEALVRLAAPPTPQQQEELQAAGYCTRYIMGTVISGAVIDVERLQELAELPFVSQIEILAHMYPEHRR